MNGSPAISTVRTTKPSVPPRLTLACDVGTDGGRGDQIGRHQEVEEEPDRHGEACIGFLELAHPFRRLGLVAPDEDPDQEEDQKADDDPIEPVLPVLLLTGDAAPEQEEHGHGDRRRGGDSAEERERVPVRALTGREERRGDDLWAALMTTAIGRTVQNPCISSAQCVAS